MKMVVNEEHLWSVEATSEAANPVQATTQARASEKKSIWKQIRGKQK